MDYSRFIEKAKFVENVESTTTTGDIDYTGTALEISDQDGKELLHVVVDRAGKKQVLFFASEENYRIPLELLERIIERAHEVVKKVGD